MCGIVGYIGEKSASSVLLNGLKRLEYRGYDSAGIALQDSKDAKEGYVIVRAQGKLLNLEEKVAKTSLTGTLGLGHTRWATHGSPSEANAHPHWSDDVVVVHNGIIENYRQLRDWLIDQGADFTSETDTEVIPHLVEFFWKKSGDLFQAFREAVLKLEGSYAIGMFVKGDRREIYAAKSRSPLILGLGEGENFLASDIPALLEHTRKIIVLENGDVARLSDDRVEVFDLEGNALERKVRNVTWTSAMAEKGGYRHFMLKEIFEQPEAVVQTIQGRVNMTDNHLTLDELEMRDTDIREMRRIVMVACGTSWHSALLGKYLIESIARVSVEVDLASEFRYRSPILDERDLVIAISQSGETTDTLCAVEEAKNLGASVLSICNVLDSSIPRMSDFNFYTHAGPEIGVASTKAFTTQLVALYLFSLYLAQVKQVKSKNEIADLVQDLIALPSLLEETIKSEDTIIKLAKRFFQFSDFLFLGRGMSFPIALEGALKLKEISYIHAEGYPAGEIKHGPIALIDDKMPVLVLAPKDATFEKTLGNLSEVKARGGITILCLTESQKEAAQANDVVDEYIITPESNPYLQPIVQSLPLQLFAYHVAVLRGTDVDQPRNLAKSVTVE